MRMVSPERYEACVCKESLMRMVSPERYGTCVCKESLMRMVSPLSGMRPVYVRRA